MPPSSNQFLSLPNELQTLIWKSYMTHTVFEEMRHMTTTYNSDYRGVLAGRVCLKYFGFKPFQSDVSGQRNVHMDYETLYKNEETDESEYSHADSWGEYAYDSSDDDSD